MGRKKNREEAEGQTAVCDHCSGPLERLMADGPFECDKCSGEIFLGGCFFGCLPCDFSLCGTCYVNEATAAAERAEKKEKYAKYEVPEGTIHPEIWGLCENYDIEERLARMLQEEMKNRFETWDKDMKKLDMIMRHVKQPKKGGIFWAQIKAMKEGTWVPWEPPRAEIQKVIDKYSLDLDSREKLTDFLQKQERAGMDWERDLWETEQRLMAARNPSMMALTMVVRLQQGLELPPIKPMRKDDVLKHYDDRHGGRDRDRRSRSRGERRQRERSEPRTRERYRSRERDGGRGSGRDDRDRHRDDRGGRDDRDGGYRGDRDGGRGYDDGYRGGGGGGRRGGVRDEDI
eukprot:gnl/MRDRNA2_/MRDRNA2_102547_c0_seq1.p1 gnl/MRDRNA2_/MRDRNA2_102547_c0~~gnl/MRDRNA2_/MRDRNA2_102547_c0_seq1.p1  ORF type:complete len:345 (-),score=58.34 gnl/MRDRNA2_/MRDRNA2_102547_c0_seq1:158-1192(-)